MSGWGGSCRRRRSPPASSSRARSSTMSSARPVREGPTCSPAAPARRPTTSAAWTRPSRQRPRACGCAPSASTRYGGRCRLGVSLSPSTTSQAVPACASWVVLAEGVDREAWAWGLVVEPAPALCLPRVTALCGGSVPPQHDGGPHWVLVLSSLLLVPGHGNETSAR